MFSSENRCVYRNNPLAEVACTLRFPEILSISANVPAEFQETIRAEFPRYSKTQNQLPPSLPGVRTTAAFQPGINHQFVSQDGIWRIILNSKSVTLSCSRYRSWEEFAGQLDKPLASFIRLYKPAYFERVGIRYVNFISRTAAGLDGASFRDLIQPCYLGPLAEEDLPETACSRCSADMEFALRGGCRAHIHTGPGLVKRMGQQDKEVKFIFDMDLFMPGQIPVQHSAGALQTIHAQSYSIFRGAITDRLHEAMDPEAI